MPQLKSLVPLAALITAATLGMSANAQAADLTFTIEGVRDGGTLYVGLQTEDQFMQNGGVAGDILKDFSAGTVVVTLSDVDPGTYSVSIWHDREDDGEFSMAPGGMPNEGWSFLNVEQLTGPPTFDDVSFELTDDGFSATLQMIYPPQ